MTLADEFAAHTVAILSYWAETLSVYRQTTTYDSERKPTRTYALNGTIDGDWQPASGATMRAEAGLSVKTEAMVYAPVSSDVNENDRIQRADGEWWYVNYIRFHEDHTEIFLKRTEGSD